MLFQDEFHGIASLHGWRRRFPPRCEAPQGVKQSLGVWGSCLVMSWNPNGLFSPKMCKAKKDSYDNQPYLVVFVSRCVKQCSALKVSYKAFCKEDQRNVQDGLSTWLPSKGFCSRQRWMAFVNCFQCPCVVHPLFRSVTAQTSCRTSTKLQQKGYVESRDFAWLFARYARFCYPASVEKKTNQHLKWTWRIKRISV